MDYAGYALISGGDDNGKYVDKGGNLYRLQDGKMIAVKTGTPHAAVPIEQEGKLIAGIQPKQLELPGAKGTERPATPEQLANEASGDSDLVAPSLAKEGEVIEHEAEEDPATPVNGDGEHARVEAILTDLAPHEIQAMLHAARNRGIDVPVLQGDDEMTNRRNAETLARITTE